MEKGDETAKTSISGIEREFVNYPIVKIKISDIVSYSKHPFKVCEDDKLRSLAGDIEKNGLQYPIIARRISLNGTFEILSGHRRAAAVRLLGWTEIEARIVYVSDPKAAMIVIQSNFLQRNKILPSEKAKSFKLRFDCLDLSKAGQDSHGANPDIGLKKDILAQEFGESASNIYRYLRLNYLIKEFMDMVDRGALRLLMAVELSYFPKSRQAIIYRYFIIDKKAALKAGYIKKMRRYESNLSEEIIDKIVSEAANPDKITINKIVDMYAAVFGNREAAEEHILKILREQLTEIQKQQKRTEVTDDNQGNDNNASGSGSGGC